MELVEEEGGESEDEERLKMGRGKRVRERVEIRNGTGK